MTSVFASRLTSTVLSLSPISHFAELSKSIIAIIKLSISMLTVTLCLSKAKKGDSDFTSTWHGGKNVISFTVELAIIKIQLFQWLSFEPANLINVPFGYSSNIFFTAFASLPPLPSSLRLSSSSSSPFPPAHPHPLCLLKLSSVHLTFTFPSQDSLSQSVSVSVSVSLCVSWTLNVFIGVHVSVSLSARERERERETLLPVYTLTALAIASEIACET